MGSQSRQRKRYSN